MSIDKRGLEALLSTTEDDNLLNMNSSDSTKEASSDIVLKHLLSTSDIDMKSRIKSRQVLPLAKLFIYEKEFKVGLAGDLARQILRLSVSEGGLGRKELTEIVRGMPAEVDAPFDPLQIKNQLFGGK